MINTKKINNLLNKKNGHNYEDFQVDIRYLEENDKVKDGDEGIFYQLNCKKSINNRIDGTKRRFDNVHYINPNQVFKHRYITFVPDSATFVWIQCRFFFGRNRQKMNSQKIFSVPHNEGVNKAINSTR